MTEAQLLNAYATHRDAEAFAEIVRRYQQLIFATCRRTLHHPDDTDDAVQETFLKLAQKAGDLRTNLGGWLHACAVHVCIDNNRRRDVRTRHESSAQPAPIATEPQIQLAELREHLDLALSKLTADQRELIIQRFFIGRSQRDIAADAGVTPSAITHRMTSAIEALRSHLKSLGCAVIAAGGTAILISALEAEHASAMVSAGLTTNLVKIGLSGTPREATAGSFSIAAVLKALTLCIGVIAASAWILLGLFDAPNPPKQASNPPKFAATSAPVMTVDAGGPGDTPSIPNWRPTTVPSRRSPLSGRVLDSEGKPVAGAVVTLHGSDADPATTDANGQYVFNRIGQGGAFRVGVEADGFIPIEPYVGKDTLIQVSAASDAHRDMVMQRGVSVWITVTDAQGKPLAGARIGGGIAGEHYGQHAIFGPESDHDGRAHLTLPVSKSPFAIGAMLDGYAPAHADVPAVSADKPQKIVLVMDRGFDATGLAICADGKPATGWGIIAEPAWWSMNLIPPAAPIDASGNFTLHNILPGAYTIRISVDNSMRQIATVTMPPATQPFRVDIPGVSPSARVKLVGRVRYVGARPGREIIRMSSIDGGLSSDVWVRTDDPHGATPKLSHNEGWFEFDSLLPGEYRLSIESANTGPGSIEEKTIEHVKIPGELPEIEVHAGHQSHIAGTVVDAATGTPISHFAVRVRKRQTLGTGPNYAQDANWTQVDNPEGRFDLQLVGPGIYQVQASADGFAALWSSEANIVPDSLPIDLALALSPGGSVSGTLLSPSGNPIAGAKVIPLSMAKAMTMKMPGEDDSFGNEAGAVTTDVMGHFNLSHIAPREETLKVVHPDFAPTQLPKCTVTEGKSTDIGTTTIPLGGAATGTVYDADGKPLPGVVLEFADPDYRDWDDDKANRFALVTTDGNGAYRVEHLPSQVIRASLPDRTQHQGQGVLQRTIRPVDGRTMRLDFGGTPALTGRCLMDGQAMQSTHIELAVQSEFDGPVMASGMTDADGRFVFHGMPAGGYTLFSNSKTNQSQWTALHEVTVSDSPSDLGDILYDTGDVLIHLTPDDPADLKNVRSVSIQSIDPSHPWKHNDFSGMPDGTASDRWLCKGVPPGECRVSVELGEQPTANYVIAFDRKAGQLQTPIVMHLPHATAALDIKVMKSADKADGPSSIAMVQNQDGTIRFTAFSDVPNANSFKLPPGTYQVMEPEGPFTEFPRQDIPAITIAENEHRDWAISPEPASAHPRPVEVRVWTVDGIFVTDAAPRLRDDQGNTIQPAQRTSLGSLFYVPAGHYRAVVQQPGKPDVTSEFDAPISPKIWERQPVDVILN
jgi:RNA polymerase sigma factor (sigma-70 family)